MVVWILAALLGFEFLYVVGVNLMLVFGGVQLLFADTDAVKADFGRAWSVWPGTVHLKNLKVVVADHNVQCLIALEHADIDIRLWELARKVFHATRLRGSGLSLHFRNRVQPEDAQARYVKALPPVPGFDDPPLYEAFVPAPPLPDQKYNLWTVHMEDVDVDIKELWAEEFRYVGKARARGAFELMPARHLWVHPARLDLEPGRLLGAPDSPLFVDFGGSIDCTVHWFDVRIPQGLEVVRHISTQMNLHGKVAGTEAVSWFTDPAADVRVDQQGGHLGVNVGVDHGVVKSGSRIELGGDSLGVRQNELRFEATGPWSVVVTADAQGPSGRVATHLSQATLGGHATAAPTPAAREGDPAPLRIEDATATVVSTSRDLAAKEWHMQEASLELGKAVAPELRVLRELAPSLPVKFVQGSGAASGRVAVQGSTVSGKGSVQVNDTAAIVGDTRIRGTAAAHGTLDDLDSDQGTFALEGAASAEAVRLDDAAKNPECPFGALKSVNVSTHLERRSGEAMRGNLDGSVEDAMARWGDTTLSGDAKLHAATDQESERASLFRASVRGAKIRLRGGNGERARWVAHAPDVTIATVLDWGTRAVAGPLRVSAEHVGGTIGKVQMSGDVAANIRFTSIESKTRTGQASGIVTVRNARLSSGERHIEDWWATVNLGTLRVAAKDNLDFDGVVTAKMRDGLPALLALSEGDKIPGWLPGLLPLNGLSGKIGLHRRCQTLDLSLPELSGGPLTASGRLSSDADRSRGAVLVQVRGAGILSAGIGFGKDSGVTLLAGDKWLRERLDAMAADENAESSAVCKKPPPEPKCGG